MANAQSKTTFVDPPGFKADAAVEQNDNDNEGGDNIEAGDEGQGEGGEGEQHTERAEQQPDAEARARKMGWRPKAEYDASGRPPEKWVDAEEFIRRGENELPVLRERSRKLEKTVTKLEGKLDEGNKLLRDLITSQKAERDKAVKSALTQAEKDRRDAISIGDVPEAERLSDVIQDHKEALKAPVAAEREQQQQSAEVPEEVLAWAEDNKSWFIPGEPEYMLAVAFHGKHPKAMAESEKLRLTKAEVVRRFPEKFTNTRRTQTHSVESGNGGGAIGRGRAGQKGWGDLPRDAQDIGERLIRMGAIKDKASYLKDYAW